MKVPFEWLKEYVATRLTPEALAERLTMAGLEVTGIEQVDGEPVLEIEVTPNRADCLSIIGVAREAAILTGQTLKLPGETAAAGRVRATGAAPAKGAVRRSRGDRDPRPVIHVEDREGCIRYIGRLIDDVRVGPSPDWMQRRLIACGARPINNVVDVTNYVLLEYGQPLHAFDFDRLAQGTILVRRARSNESITTLDGVRRVLSSDMLVIADAQQAVAVAGVMGGIGSEVTPHTRTLLLESALFDPVMVRRTARKLGLASGSSYRFERGVDPMGVETASARAASLIRELAGGEELAQCDVGSKPLKRTGIIIDAGRASRWLGMPLSPTAIRTVLARLSCHVASSGAESMLHVGVPSFRRDLTQDVDLYEELARTVGYDRIPASLPTVSLAVRLPEETASYQRAQSLRCLCASLGLTEAITWSLISESDLTRCGYAASDAARLSNPLSQDHAYLRPSLLPGMLRVLCHNLSRGQTDVRIFEIGAVVRHDNEPETRELERTRLGIMLSGLWFPDWTTTREACSFWVLKGLIQALTGRLCSGPFTMTAARYPWSDAGESAEARVDGRVVGSAGKLSRQVCEAFDAAQEVWFAELSVAALLAVRRSRDAVTPPTAFPPVKRDLSFLVGETTAFEAVKRTITEAGGALASRVELVDRFTGKQVPAGKYSLTFSIEYRDSSRTLTAAEADEVHQRIGRTLVERFGAVLR